MYKRRKGDFVRMNPSYTLVTIRTKNQDVFFQDYTGHKIGAALEFSSHEHVSVRYEDVSKVQYVRLREREGNALYCQLFCVPRSVELTAQKNCTKRQGK